MHKSTKILIGFLIGFIFLALTFVGYTYLIKGKNTTKPNNSILQTIADVGNSYNPGKIIKPIEIFKAKTLSAEKIIELTNEYRVKAGVKPLIKNDILTKAAQTKVDDMFSTQYFEHISPTGTTPAQLVLKTGYNYKTTGENLALGDFQNEQDLVDAWYGSPGHRENMLNPAFTEIGVASNLNDFEGRNTWLSVQEFGTLAPNCTEPSTDLSNNLDKNKTKYQTLNTELGNLNISTQKLIDEANAQITLGNQIYSESKSKAKAQPYWDKGKALWAEAQADLAEAQKLDAKLKTLFSTINSQVDTYNKQVSVYKQCIAQ